MGQRLWAVMLLAGCTGALDFSEECERDEACASLGPNLICVSGKCAPSEVPDGMAQPRDMSLAPGQDAQVNDLEGLLTRGCRLLGTTASDARLIGAFLPVDDRAAEAGLSHAAGDINATDGLLGQPIGVLACPTPETATETVELGRMLAEVISEPAIIGTGNPMLDSALYTPVISAYGVVLMTPGLPAPTRLAVGDDGLLWHIRGSERNEATALARMVLDESPSSVALLYRADQWGEAQRGQVEDVLCAAGLCPDRAVSAHPFTPYSSDVWQAATDTVDADAILAIGRPDDAVPLLGALADVGAERVFALGAPRTAAALGQIFSLDDAGETRLPPWRAEARSALLCGSGTVGPTRRGPAWDSWSEDFGTVWPDVDAEAAAPYVDAVFALAYAIAAVELGGGELTGARVSSGFSRLVSGPTVRVGRIDWNAGIAGLSEGDIDLEGVSGALRFDRMTGVAQGGVDATWYDGTPDGIEPAGEVLDVDGRYTAPTPQPVCEE